MIQGTELVGGNLEDVDADIQSEPIPSGVALSGTPISMANGEGPSVPMTWQVADAWIQLQKSVRDVATQLLKIIRGDAPVPRPPKPTRQLAVPIRRTSAKDVPIQRLTRAGSIPILQISVRSAWARICDRCPHSKVSNSCERCHGPVEDGPIT